MTPLPVDLPAPRHPVDVAVLVRRTSALLQAGVPLTLLLDLSDDQGPRSAHRYDAEGGDAGWLHDARPRDRQPVDRPAKKSQTAVVVSTP